MLVDQQFRGGLFFFSAPLLLFLSSELLKWQFPALAASEKLAALASFFRASS